MTEKLRTVQILRAGVYYHEDFEDIKRGDIFKIIEDNKIVTDDKGNWLFKAMSRTYMDEETGFLMVDVVVVDGNDEDLGVYDGMYDI
jgi:hypothetical protein